MEEEREKAAAEMARMVEDKAMKKYGELVLTLVDGIGSSRHLLKGGKQDALFFDFDFVVEDPSTCKKIAEWFCDKIQQVAEYHGEKPDFLAFIEKDGIGTVGALRLSSLISSLTGIPNIVVRLIRELPYERIKISKKYQVENRQRLKGKNVLIISDVTTTGTELLDATKEVKANGGNVAGAIVYLSRCTIETQNKLQDKGTTLYALITEPKAIVTAFTELADNPYASKIRDTFSSVDKVTPQKQSV